MIITLNTRAEFIPGTLIVDKNKGVYGVVLSIDKTLNQVLGPPMICYKVKSLNLSKYRITRKFQLFIIKKAFN